MRETINAIVGIATIYAGQYISQPLYCDDGRKPGLYYTMDAAPWIALDVSEFTSGRAVCGDEFWIEFENGEWLMARALDAGYLYKYYIADYPDLKILADIPAHLAPFRGLSSRIVSMINVSRITRDTEYWTELCPM